MAFREGQYMTGTVNIVSALPAEAKPLMDHFKLRSSQTDHFKIYTNSDDNVRLIISGVGKSAAAGAVKHLTKLSCSNTSDGWLNVGVAGHASLPIGTLVAAHKITDAGTGRAWYPPMVLNFPFETASLLTVKEETHNYPADALVEMEAAGFYSTASNFSIHELIHCLKVVSDNRNEKKLDSRSVTEMITTHLDAVESVVHSLLRLSKNFRKRRAVPRELEHFLNRWKFTVTQSHQLEKMLRRWEVIFPETNPLEAASTGSKNSRDVLKSLYHRLTDATVEASQL